MQPEHNPNVLWLALRHVPKLGAVTIRQLFSRAGTIQAVWQSLPLSNSDRQAYINAALSEKAAIDQEKIILLTIDSKDYPSSLLDIPDAPVVLYARGRVSLLQRPMIAIVGSRIVSDYGREVTQKLVNQLVAQQFCIVSGMAIGIDSVAHQTALNGGGDTIAVLGSGLDALADNLNTRLVNGIVESGLCISQFPLGTPGQKFTFPARNRVLAGLSQAVVVTQASLKSGSLLTAQAAIEYHRPVFAVPGNIFNPGSAGTHQLINQGAHLTVDAADIVKKLPHPAPASSAQRLDDPTDHGVTEPEKQLITLLQTGAKSTDELIRHSRLPSAQVSATVSLLEIKNLIAPTGEGQYRVIESRK